MDILPGGIYEVDEKWNPDNPLLNRRPVIVLKSNIDSIEGVFIGILPSSANQIFQLSIEYERSGKKCMSAVACDMVYKISKSYIKEHLGYVNDEVLWTINSVVKEFKRESNSIKMHEKTIKILDGINITNERKFEELFEHVAAIGENTSIIALIEENTAIIKENTVKIKENIALVKENTIISKDILEKVNSKINVWKERFIGFVFGIVASLIASIIWEKRNELLQEIYLFIIRLIQIFTSHQT